MSDEFSIDYDTACNFMRFTVRGLWTIATVQRYQEAILNACDKMHRRGCISSEMLVLIDARALNAQPQNVVTAYDEMMADDRFTVRRVATIVSSALFKMQAERLARSSERTFKDDDSALEWLYEGVPERRRLHGLAA